MKNKKEIYVLCCNDRELEFINTIFGIKAKRIDFTHFIGVNFRVSLDEKMKGGAFERGMDLIASMGDFQYIDYLNYYSFYEEFKLKEKDCYIRDRFVLPKCETQVNYIKKLFIDAGNEIVSYGCVHRFIDIYSLVHGEECFK